MRTEYPDYRSRRRNINVQGAEGFRLTLEGLVRTAKENLLLLLSFLVLAIPLLFVDLSVPAALLILVAVLAVDFLILRLPRR